MHLIKVLYKKTLSRAIIILNLIYKTIQQILLNKKKINLNL